MNPNELVVDTKTGRVRQAGATTEGHWVQEFKARAESDLYTFGKGVLGLTRLTPTLHLPTCQWLQEVSRRRRKLLLMPRDHLKTSIMRALVIHLLIQPKDTNRYFPNRDGGNTRILLANETATNAEHQLRWIAGQFESNQILRSLWPHRTWDNPRKEARKWNEKELSLPRAQDFPEASVETIGVGGAVTGRHYDVFIKDDLISIEAANSDVTMHNAIEWNRTSRALMDDPKMSLEFMIGTRWAAYDLYQEIINKDPSVEVVVRSAIEGGNPIFPEYFDLETLEQLRRELGALYFLLYHNSALDPALTDFDLEEVRDFEIVDGRVTFDDDERDVFLGERMHAPLPRDIQSSVRGLPLSSANHSKLFGAYKMREKMRSVYD